MDHEDTVEFLITTVGSFLDERLVDNEQRMLQKEQCFERLAAENEALLNTENSEFRYSDQAVLANLDWGIDALEEAINTSNTETKMARLEYAEKMLQVCAMLNSTQKTAGVPNFYLSAWAHLNLAYLCKLRDDVHHAAIYLMEMFVIDPFFSRIDFAPQLWESLFLPHMSSVVGWYTQEKHRIMMDAIPDSNDLSFTEDFDLYFNESLVLSVRPDQAERMEKLEELYGQSLNENTKLYAKYYKDCLNVDDSSSPGKRVIQPMFPIAEPPMTPLQEVSRMVPDYVKFGPILTKNAGFSRVLKAKEDTGENLRYTSTTTSCQKLDTSPTWSQQSKDESFGEDPYNFYRESDLNEQPKDGAQKIGSPGMKDKVPEAKASVPPGITKSSKVSKKTTNPVASRRRSSVSSPNPGRQCKKELPVSTSRLATSPFMEHATSGSSTSAHGSATNSVHSDDEKMKQDNSRKDTSHSPIRGQLINNRLLDGMDEGSERCNPVLPMPEMSTPQSRPPKDFVCPITGLIFNDPLTLESGQTYERRAIEEWINRGNTTCPITRQPISAITLPKTNYVLKRLICSWREQHPDVAQEISYLHGSSCLTSPSPRERSLSATPVRSHHLTRASSIKGRTEKKSQRFMRTAVRTSENHMTSQAAIETIKPYISTLSTSEDLAECESAVLTIARIADSRIHTYLSSPTVVNGFMEILSASLNRDVLRSTIYILSDIIFADESVGETLTSVDTDFDTLSALLKNGLAEATVLIHLLKPSISQLSAQKFIPSLSKIISSKEEDLDDLPFVISPKDAALSLLEQIITGISESNRPCIVKEIIASGCVPALVRCIHRLDGRQSVVSILLFCMRSDRSCRNMIANRLELNPVVDLFHSGSDTVRGICIEFFSELVKLSRISLHREKLKIIKEEGAFSTMHTLLVYLQMSPMDQKPAIATLLIQLDLLVEPRKMSIYREEAIESLIEALCRRDFPASQSMALDALSSICGHMTASGKSCIGDWLLQIAGSTQSYSSSTKGLNQEIDETGMMVEEEKAASSWAKKLAFVLCNHEKGIIFKALKECLKSKSVEVKKSCLVMATWLVHMIFEFSDIGVRDVARKALLEHFINVLRTSKSLDEKILASLALKCFISDPSALDELGVYSKSIFKCLRKIKKSCTVANDILKALMNSPCLDMEELWHYSECFELEASMNGEFLSILFVRGRFISGHSDGTIKVWDVGRKNPRLVQEVRDHSKAVTCLQLSPSSDKLFSGSLDKTIRVWSIKQDEIHCIQVHDVKEPVLEMRANSDTVCFTSQGTGVKVHDWSGPPRHVNFNKHVKCLALSDTTLYCGCTGLSIQEIEIETQSSTTFYSGTRKILGKQTIYSLQLDNDRLYVGGSSVDGIAGKVFSITTKGVIGTLSSSFDIHQINVNNDLIFTASRCGIIEVWIKARMMKVASIRTGGEGSRKLTSITTDDHGDMIFAAFSDGKIQVWNLQ
ncbi:hypothetical protein LIER_10751 [Lithospermum erythrorhizon]|uniref:RING-type E3 ubiquitin transferase n=1 Tax=Lithospermum erythrorhizon TaxID=34254 RepID=A0AAV3PKK8_LITER